MMIYLTTLTLKQRTNMENNKHKDKTPDEATMKDLVLKIMNKLPKEGKQQKFSLTKQEFSNKFHLYLYEIHDKWPKI